MLHEPVDVLVALVGGGHPVVAPVLYQHQQRGLGWRLAPLGRDVGYRAPEPGPVLRVSDVAYELVVPRRADSVGPFALDLGGHAGPDGGVLEAFERAVVAALAGP